MEVEHIDVDARLRTFSSDNELVATRRKQIAISAGRLLVKRGYNDASMRDIAEACNMGIGTLYNYIGTKEDILYLVLAHNAPQYKDSHQEIEDSLEEMSATEALAHAIDLVYHTVDNTQDFIIFAYTEMKNLPREAREHILIGVTKVIDAFEKVLVKGCSSGEFQVDDVRLMAHNIAVTGEMWAVRRWQLRKMFTIDQYVEKNTSLFLKAVRAA